jgi:hypothetical protein
MMISHMKIIITLILFEVYNYTLMLFIAVEYLL